MKKYVCATTTIPALTTTQIDYIAENISRMYDFSDSQDTKDFRTFIAVLRDIDMMSYDDATRLRKLVYDSRNK